MAQVTSPATGARTSIAIGEQTLYETPVAPTHLIDFTSESIQASETVLLSDAITGSRGRKFIGRGNIDVTGDINIELAPDGFGMPLRHALGDYLTIEGANGGIHARIEGSEQQITSLSAGNPYQNTTIIPLADETVATFIADGGFCHVTQDVNGTISVDTNGGGGHAYNEMNVYDLTSISAINNNDADTFGDSAYSITLNLNNDGVAALVNADAGILEYGADRVSVRYYEATDVGGGLMKVFLDPSQIAPLSALPTDPAANDVVIVKPAITALAASFSIVPTKGDWILEYDSTEYAGVYTHVLMAGNTLPVAGLTIEVHRDAGVFLYSGAKIATFTATFEPDAFVTGAFSYLARREHVEAQLQADVIPGATELFIDDADHWQFPDPGALAITEAIITVDEKTNITYTTKEVDYNGTGWTRLSGIPGAGDNAIDEVRLRGSAVASRTSTRADTTYEGDKTPLVMWMATVYMKGVFEEGLSGSLTIENNLNGDKFGFGSQYRFGAVEERRDVTASITVEYDDNKHVTRFKKGEIIALEFRAVSENDDAELLETGIPAQAHFFMPRARLTGSTPNVEDTSFITHELPMTCLDDPDYRTPGLVIFLVNDKQYDVAAP